MRFRGRTTALMAVAVRTPETVSENKYVQLLLPPRQQQLHLLFYRGP